MHRLGNWRRMLFLNGSSVSPAQRAALARVLASRYRRLCAGDLYRMGGLPLPEPTEAVTLDIALVLIGLCECLKNPDAAEKAVREIVVLFLRSTDLSDQARRMLKPERLDLRNELEMLKLWLQHREGSPMAAVLSYAARLPSREPTEPHWDRSTTTQLPRALFPDASALYSKVLNLFGRGLYDTLMVESPNARTSPTRTSVRAA